MPEYSITEILPKEVLPGDTINFSIAESFPQVTLKPGFSIFKDVATGTSVKGLAVTIVDPVSNNAFTTCVPQDLPEGAYSISVLLNDSADMIQYEIDSGALTFTVMGGHSNVRINAITPNRIASDAFARTLFILRGENLTEIRSQPPMTLKNTPTIKFQIIEQRAGTLQIRQLSSGSTPPPGIYRLDASTKKGRIIQSTATITVSS